MNNISLGLDNLKFFTGDGKEIIMKRQFSAAWEIIPHTFVYPAFYRNPSGHFEVTRPKNLTSLWTNAAAVPDGLGHVVSAPVVLTPGHYYTVTATPDDLNDFIVLCDKYGTKQGSVTPRVTNTTITVKLICPAAGGITVVESDAIDIDITGSDEITQFTVRTSVSDETREMTEYSGTSIVVVDEPGQVQPFARFARRPHDRDFIYDHTRLTSRNGVVIDTGDDDVMYREITGETSNDWTLTDIYDILFFSYKDITDGKEHEEGNIIRITLNDSKDIVTHDYLLTDFLRCTQNTAVTENLVTFSSYDVSNPSDPTESLEDLMNYDTTRTERLYGVKSALFAEVLMANYQQYSDDDFAALSKLILYIHKHPEKTDTEIVGMLHTFFRERRIEPEWWSSPQILDIVRRQDEQTQAEQLFDYVTYGPDTEVYKSVTVARYIIDYNIPDDQYPYVRYYGTVYQEKVSAGLISS